MMIVFAVLLILVVWWVVRSAGRHEDAGTGVPPEDSALEALKRRYARGELTDEEFEEKKRRLQG